MLTPIQPKDVADLNFPALLFTLSGTVARLEHAIFGAIPVDTSLGKEMPAKVSLLNSVEAASNKLASVIDRLQKIEGAVTALRNGLIDETQKDDCAENRWAS